MLDLFSGVLSVVVTVLVLVIVVSGWFIRFEAVVVIGILSLGMLAGLYIVLVLLTGLSLMVDIELVREVADDLLLMISVGWSLPLLVTRVSIGW